MFSLSFKENKTTDLKNYKKNTAVMNEEPVLTEDETLPLEENNDRAYLSHLVSAKLLDQWFPEQKPVFINTGPGAGKSTLCKLSVKLLSEKTVQLVVFRNEMDDMDKELWKSYGIEPMSIRSVQQMNGTSHIDAILSKSVQSYTNVLFKAYASKLYADIDISNLSQNELRHKVRSAIRDKSVFVDECDFIISQIIAETEATFNEFGKVVKSKIDNINEKLEALKEFYTFIKKYSKRLIFMSATSNEIFNSILEYLDATTISPEFLEKKLEERNGRTIKLTSFNLKSLFYIGYIQKKLDTATFVSDHIISHFLLDSHYKCTMLYSTRINVQSTANIIATAVAANKKVKIITSPDRINKGWEMFVGKDSRRKKVKDNLSRLENFKKSVFRIVEAKLRHIDFDRNIFDVIQDTDPNNTSEVESSLNDQVVQDYDITLITTSNARAVSINAYEGEDVLVITDELSSNTEVVQSWARFRKAHVHAVVLSRYDRKIRSSREVSTANLSKHYDHEGNLITIPETEFSHITAHLGGHINRDLTDYNQFNKAAVEYMSGLRRTGLKNRNIACVEEIKSWSNLDVEEDIVSRYAEYEVMYKDLPVHLKISRKGKGTKNNNKNEQLASFLIANPKASYEEIEQHFQSLLDWKPSNYLINKVKKELKDTVPKIKTAKKRRSTRTRTKKQKGFEDAPEQWL